MSNVVVNPYLIVASGGGSLSTADTDAYYCCGVVEAWVTQDTTQYFNGSSWSSGTANNQALATHEGRGNLTDFMILGGFSTTVAFPALDNAYSWNGSTWTSHDDVMGENRAVGFAMSGNSTGGFINGGQDGSGGTQFVSSESFDSTPTFSTEASSSYGGQGTQGSGNTDTNFIRTGGYGNPTNDEFLITESYSGGSWTNEGQSYPYNYAYGYGNSCASGRESFIVCSNISATTDAIAKFEGSSWTYAGATTYSHSQSGGMGGDSTNAMAGGGWGSDDYDLYNGTTFASSGQMNFVNCAGGMGANS